jgi:DNA repair protein RecN (Recombination protein N)
MISKLYIQNYAIIDQLEIHFEHGLNIITGETGAGKSILMGALNLILGQRADSSVLQDPQKKCIIEGLFKINKSQQVLQFFQLNELDFENEILIRREIAANGKSRSFINDTPVNLSQIKALSVHLVDLHQQFDTLEINSESFQRDVLDALSDHSSLLLDFKKQFETYQQEKKALAQLKIEQEQANKELDYNQFLFSELDELSLKENELEEIEAELKLLNNAERIKLQLSAVYGELSNSEQPVINQLKTINNKLKLLDDFHPELSNLFQRMNSAIIEVQDISDELERIESQVKYDEERISILNDRLSAGYKLLKKHGFSTTAQLIDLKESLQVKLDGFSNVFASIEALEKSLVKLYDACLISAKKISGNRKKQIDGFVKEVNRLLAQVGMPNARLNVSISETELNMFGIDSIEFLFDANKSNKFEPIGKVASGGELSRLMLSIKSLVAQKLALPTLIFDEIDTGISGEAAKQVGLIMKSLSTSHQLIAITHQAQIAAKASTHFFVYKEVKEEKITTSIRILNEAERINAIAQMLSGEKPTTAALENAKEMMSN